MFLASQVHATSLATLLQEMDSLRANASYDASAKTGLYADTRKGADGTRYHYAVWVPEDYNPNKSYSLILVLHGLVDRDKGSQRQAIPGLLKQLHQQDAIMLFPAAWRKAKWWQTPQVDNLLSLIEETKAKYHVDSNKIFVEGVSDGGHGTYYLAAHAPTLFAGFIPMIGSPFVAAKENGASHDTFLVNLLNKPMLVLNAEFDKFYDIGQHKSFADTMVRNGAQLDFHELKGAHHDVNWYPSVHNLITDFIQHTQRNPYPDSFYWEVDSELNYPRFHWLLIESVPQGTGRHLINARREGNRIFIDAENIASFRLLISPEMFNFDHTLEVSVNGQWVYQSQPIPDPAILHKWFERDNDVQQLYGAEILIKVPVQ
ncbi:dienelactone hydrolase family protein [Shewanella cyperi]|uniref:Dienelactone hydrolase family protein n=1 Tax=Shewanella cyperi TaxID=2814292 RepID=A0A974XLJ3_9GAMM|nr:dienelactone hydrolase family protein [Shewanella cyperi]QSX30604.1 dienelactone hydrolase family protein [Shewanella cyperi]